MDNVLVAYATKTGTTADVAAMLAKRLTKPCHLYDLSKKPRAALPDLRAFDTVVLGTGMYCGMPRRELVAFCRENETQLLGKKLYLYSCGIGTQEEDQGYLQKEMPASLMEHLAGYFHVGGEIRLERLGWLARFGMKQFLKQQNSKPGLDEKSIDALAAAIDTEGE